PSISAAADIEGRASMSSTSAGLCLVDDDEGPINIAQISATLEQQDRAEKAKAQRVDMPSSNSSTSARLCIAEDSEGPMDFAGISATLEQQDQAEKEDAQRIKTPASQTGNPHVMAQSDLILMGGDRLAELWNRKGGDYLAEAYTVPDETVYEATPTLPWFKQRRTKLLVAAILALLAVLAVSMPVAFTREPVLPMNEPTLVLKTNEPTFSPAPSASSTSLPSISSAPSLSCESKVLATKKKFNLLQRPDDIKDIKVSMDGVDAAVVWHNGKPRARLYVYFFQLSERRRDWGLVTPFQEDMTTAIGKDDFDVSLSGNVAVVGVFPQNRTLTYQNRGSILEPIWEPLPGNPLNLPDMTSFSFRDGLLVVMAGGCTFTSCMSSAFFFKQRDGNWLKIDDLTVDDGDYFDALIDGELVLLRYRTRVYEDYCSSSLYKLIEGEIVVQDQRLIEGCGQMVMDEGLLAHAADGGVVMHQKDGSVFVANHYFTPGEAEALELSLHNNVLAVAGLQGDKIKVFSNVTGDNAMNWTEVLQLDFFNASLYDAFELFGGFLGAVKGPELFTFDLSRCKPSLTVVPAEKEIAEDCYPVNILFAGYDWTATINATVQSADGEPVGKTLPRPNVTSYGKEVEKLCLFEGQYKFELRTKTRTTREYRTLVRLKVPKRDSSFGRPVLLRGNFTGDEFIESTVWVPFDLDSPENRLPTPFPTYASTSGYTWGVGTSGTLSPTESVTMPPFLSAPTTPRPTTPFPTVSDRPSLSKEPTLAPSASTWPSDSKNPSTLPSIAPTATPTTLPSDLPSWSPSDKPTSRPSEEPRYCITISIVYDYFPTETSWKLISDEDGAIVHEYKETDDTATSHFVRFCLTEGWYTFKVFDELGDGISDEDNGQGSYTITSDGDGRSDGIIFVQGGEFADIDAANFVLPYVSVSPSASPSCGGSIMMIQIQYNFYPDAISFELKKIVLEHGQETVLAIHGGVGGVGSAGDENLEESICLGDGLYSFSLYDSSGIGFYSEYSLTLLPGETIVKRDNSKSLYGERVKFRLPFDRATLDVRRIGSDGQLLTLAPTDNPTASNKPTLRPTNYRLIHRTSANHLQQTYLADYLYALANVPWEFGIWDSGVKYALSD
ncbi:hypothetical protein THAOC_22158, partial [Thalassiosira oceanica]